MLLSDTAGRVKDRALSLREIAAEVSAYRRAKKAHPARPKERAADARALRRAIRSTRTMISHKKLLTILKRKRLI